MQKRMELVSSTSQLHNKSFATTSFSQNSEFGVPLQLSEVQLSFSNTSLYCIFAEICSQMSVPTVNSEGLRWNTSTVLVFHSLSNFVHVGGKLKQHLPTTYWYWLGLHLVLRLPFVYYFVSAFRIVLKIMTFQVQQSTQSQSRSSNLKPLCNKQRKIGLKSVTNAQLGGKTIFKICSVSAIECTGETKELY